jgi:hypothetical protein
MLVIKTAMINDVHNQFLQPTTFGISHSFFGGLHRIFLKSNMLGSSFALLLKRLQPTHPTRRLHPTHPAFLLYHFEDYKIDTLPSPVSRLPSFFQQPTTSGISHSFFVGLHWIFS